MLHKIPFLRYSSKWPFMMNASFAAINIVPYAGTQTRVCAFYEYRHVYIYIHIYTYIDPYTSVVKKECAFVYKTY